QQCVDPDRLQVCHLHCYLLRRTDQHAADGCEFIVAPSTPDTAGELLEPFVRVVARWWRCRQRRQVPEALERQGPVPPRFLGHGCRLLVVIGDSELGELARTHALADAKIKASLRQIVEHGGLRSEAEGMMKR